MSYNYKPIYRDTDSVKMPSADYLKSELNALYGIEVNGYWQPTILKENKIMNREYIVVHYQDHKTGIIFKDKIDGVFNEAAGDVEETRIMINGQSTFVMDKYADIVKQLI